MKNVTRWMIPAFMLAATALPASGQERAPQAIPAYGAGPNTLPVQGWGGGPGMGPGYGPDHGMMGRGFGMGPGPGYGMAPGQGMGPGYGMGPGGQGMGPGYGMGPGMMMGPLWSLNLSEEQRQAIDNIMREQQQTHMQLMNQMMEESGRLQQLYSQQEWDAKAIGEVYDRIFEAQRQGITAMIESRNRIHEQLTEEQRQQLQQFRWQ